MKVRDILNYLAHKELDKIRRYYCVQKMKEDNLKKETISFGECLGCNFRDENNLPYCIGCPCEAETIK